MYCKVEVSEKPTVQRLTCMVDSTVTNRTNWSRKIKAALKNCVFDSILLALGEWYIVNIALTQEFSSFHDHPCERQCCKQIVA